LGGNEGARLSLLGIADQAGLVHLLAGQAEVLDRSGFDVPVRNLEIPPAAVAGNLAPLLRGVVLVREPARRRRFMELDLEAPEP